MEESKVCNKCGQEKLIRNFPKDVSGKYHRNTCSKCIREWDKLPAAEREAIKLAKRTEILTRIEKKCSKCNTIKPIDQFYKSDRNADGKMTECKRCDTRRTVNRRSELVRTLKDRQIPITHTCQKCGEEKSYLEFNKNVRLVSGLDSTCKKCSKQTWLQYANDDTNRKKMLLRRVQTKSERLNIEFDLTLDDIIIPDVCPILGIPLRFGNRDKGYTQSADESSPSLDRIDPDGGYIKSNVLVISWRANRLKGNASIEELIKLAEFYKKYYTKVDV